MVKRSRESTVEFSIENNIVIVEHNGTRYVCNMSVEELNKLKNDNGIDYDIIHNFLGKPILSIEDLQSNRSQRIHLNKTV